ncbi:MAG TPA: wax ester/triacylglycerol synthase family O-acyltransferase [Actinomycetota bacterium]|nr:wax ester/triacylglycerol synthase family O-acyltransferase [Actinomycetota bacterium]
MAERLSALDAAFLYLERPAMHMHVAGLSVLDPSSRPDGTLRFEDVASTMASRLHLVPRFRQKVAMVPLGLGLPLWVDDASFDLTFHLRRTALPAPGGRRELADSVQRVLSRPLDRSKPLWELYVIEGLEGGHVATLLKVHHAMIDGLSGMHLAAAMYDLSPDSAPPAAPPPWEPEPAPSGRDLVEAAARELATHPLEALVTATATVLRSPALAALGLGSVLSGARSIFDMGARPPSPFDLAIGPNRRFAMTEAPMSRFKEIKDALDGTVNDVVLAAVGGALYRVLRSRRERTRGRTLRVMVPVSVRAGSDGAIGNRVAPAFVDLPVGPMSAKRRLAQVRESTRHLKESMMAMSADTIIALGAYAPGGLLAAATRLASRGPWFNLVVSNIPGPQQPMYLAGARLVAAYPSMPLGENSALSIACTSLGGTMGFGITADWDGVPDVDSLAFALDESIAELAKAAGV